MGKFLDYPIILHLKRLSNSIKPYSTPLSIVFPIMVGLIPWFFSLREEILPTFRKGGLHVLRVLVSSVGIVQVANDHLKENP